MTVYVQVIARGQLNYLIHKQYTAVALFDFYPVNDRYFSIPGI